MPRSYSTFVRSFSLGLVLISINLVLVVAQTSDTAVTLEEIIAQCAEAMGGQEMIDSLTTLDVTLRYSDHSGLTYYDIERPNRSRFSNYLVFDGSQAAMLEQNEGGRITPPDWVPEEEWIDFEVEIGWLFPAFFDYPASFIGMDEIEGQSVYLLEVILPLGAVITYFVDVETNLMIRARSVFDIGDMHVDTERNYRDYRDVGGFLYPFEFDYIGRHGVALITVVDFAYNVVFSTDNFSIPPSLLESSD